MIGSTIHIYKNQGDFVFEESPQVNDLAKLQDQRSIIFKSGENPPWRVATSQRLGWMIGLSVHNYKSQEEIPLGETTQVNDLDR